MQLHHRSAPCHSHARASVRVAPRTRTVAMAATVDVSKQQEAVGILKQIAKQPGSIPPQVVLQNMVQLEKMKWQPPENDWSKLVKGVWKLVYVAQSPQVKAASQGDTSAKGNYFPLVAAQCYDNDEVDFENGVFLGPVASLTFDGPFKWSGRQLMFDHTRMLIRLGPWTLPINIKKDPVPIDKMDTKDQKALPFFLFAYADEEIMVARGRSGGLAVWAKPTSEWQAKAGVLQVYGNGKGRQTQ